MTCSMPVCVTQKGKKPNQKAKKIGKKNTINPHKFLNQLQVVHETFLWRLFPQFNAISSKVMVQDKGIKQT